MWVIHSSFSGFPLHIFFTKWYTRDIFKQKVGSEPEVVSGPMVPSTRHTGVGQTLDRLRSSGPARAQKEDFILYKQARRQITVARGQECSTVEEHAGDPVGLTPNLQLGESGEQS